MERSKVLLASTLWWPLSAKLATRFIRYGCEVSVVCPPGHVLGHVRGIHRVYEFSPLDSLASLEAAIETARPDLVVPCDDRVVWQLHELHAERPRLRDLIEASLGPASEYRIIDRRDRLLETAEELGIRVAQTRCVRNPEDVLGWFAQGRVRSVMKVDRSWGGNGVEMVDSAPAALEAFERLSRPMSLGTALKRAIVNRDPLAAWAWRRRDESPVTLQRFVQGRPANLMVACWRGEALASVTVEVLSSQGPTGAGLVVRVIENAEIARAAELLAKRLQLTGFYGLDFMLEDGTRSPHLIEMNPRCTQLGHLVLASRGDLVRALCAKLLGRPPSEKPPAPIEGDVVAFFPQCLQADPPSRFADGAHLDVPWDHPDLVRELLRPSWPERHLLARLYHRLRPPRRTPTVDFDEPVAAVPAAARTLRRSRRPRLLRRASWRGASPRGVT